MTKLTLLAATLAAGLSGLAILPAAAEPAAAAETGATTLKKIVSGRFDKERAEDPGIDETTTASIAAPAQPYASIIRRYAAQHGVPEQLAFAVVQVESNYRADARGRAGEVGLMQIKPATARMMGYSGGAQGLYDPETNIRFGMKYLGKARQLSDGSTCGTILKYNAGHGAKRMNPVSRNYCSKVERILSGTGA
jgi:soluble lytic murein transglycosylase-like protein